MTTKRILCSTALVLMLGTAWAQDVTLTYWQYDFESKVGVIDTLIERFEEANPGITVEQQTFPYDAFQQQIAAAVPAGQGPDVVNLFYGWLPAWADAGYLIPLPEDAFGAASLEEAFIPTVQAARYKDSYWGLPTAVRNLALFYNQDLLEEAGITEPPATWDAFIAAAKELTVGENGRFTQIGYGVAPDGQDHNLVREILVRQFGGAPYSDDNTQVSYNGAEGKEAFDFYTSWVTDEQIGVPDFIPGGASGTSAGYRSGFLAGRIAMIIDGSFAIDTFREAGFNWGVAELPVREEGGTQVNFSSFWMHGLTPLAEETPETLEAATKFLQFITSEEAMQLWLDEVGELPARASLAEAPELAEDPIYGPFIRALPYSTATFFVNEDEQRRIMLDAINRVWLQDAEPAASLDQAAEEEQALLDSFYSE